MDLIKFEIELFFTFIIEAFIGILGESLKSSFWQYFI